MMAIKKQLNKPFHFRQFSLYHHNSTMKVGTDAILLGVWCDVENADYILDIGTGSGIIALLMAARSMAMIHAVELDDQSVMEARDNFTKSIFANQLNIYEDDFNNFFVNTKQKYDLIISNPPFFSDSLLPDNKSRKAARHTFGLSHQELCEGVTSLLSHRGKFCLVLPYNIANDFIKTANGYNLHLHKQLIIYSKLNTIPNRINMEFRFENTSLIITEEIIIRNDIGTHSNQYSKYVSDYLIKI